MALFGFFKTEKPRRFDPKPRYYDERKERLEKLMADKSYPSAGEDYREHLREGWSKRRKTRVNHMSTLRVLLLAALLFAIARYFFYQ